MLCKQLTTALALCLLLSVPAFSADEGTAAAPSLDELKAVVRPLLDQQNLTDEQKKKADTVMTEEIWKATLEGFKVRREGEIFRATHTKMNALVPTIMAPKMMAISMKKMRSERKGKRAGPPSKAEIEARQKSTKDMMHSKLNPQLMGNLQGLAAARIEEILADKKAMVRLLGERLSTAVLTAEQRPDFDKALSGAGYTGDLIRGDDAVLDERMRKMAAEVTARELAAYESAK